MTISKFLYCSEATFRKRHMTDRNILETSRMRNTLFSVTGFLLRGESTFFQVIEGSPKRASIIFESIMRDPRHRVLGSWVIEDAEERSFPSWQMGYSTLTLKAQGQMLSAFRNDGISASEKLAALKYHTEIKAFTPA